MDVIKSRNFSLAVVEHVAGFANFCNQCRELHSAGTWAVGIAINDGAHKYLVGHPEPFPTCCGVEKSLFIKVFDAAEAAEAFAEQVADQILTDGSTKNVNLLEFHVLGSGATH